MRKPKRLKPRLRDVDGTEYDPETGFATGNIKLLPWRSDRQITRPLIKNWPGHDIENPYD